MSEMVRRVALAIEKAKSDWDSSPKLDHAFSPAPGDPDVFSLFLARAAIEAMREPTEAMAEAYNDQLGEGHSPHACFYDDCYTAAINAALKD